MSLVVLCDMLVAIEAGGGGGGLPVPGASSTVINEDSPSTNLEVITKLGAVRQDVLTGSTSADGDWGWFKQDALGRLWTSGTYLEDAAHTSGDPGVMSLGVAATTPASSAASGDYTFLATNVMGTQYTEPSNQVATYADATVSGAAGAVPTTGVNVLTNSAKAKIVTIGNTLDVPVLISLNAGTNYIFLVPALTGTAVIDLGTNGRWTASNIFAKAIGSNSSSGNLYVGLTI